MPHETEYTRVLVDGATPDGSTEEEAEGSETVDLVSRSSVDTEDGLQGVCENDYLADTAANEVTASVNRNLEARASRSTTGAILRFTTNLSKSVSSALVNGFSRLTDRSAWQACTDTCEDGCHNAAVILRVCPSADVRASWVSSWLPDRMAKLLDKETHPSLAPVANALASAGVIGLWSCLSAGCCVCVDCSQFSCCYDCYKEIKDEGRARFLTGRYDPNEIFVPSKYYSPAALRRWLRMPLSVETAEVRGYAPMPAEEMIVYPSSETTSCMPAEGP